jgi:hypothetical protein
MSFPRKRESSSLLLINKKIRPRPAYGGTKPDFNALAPPKAGLIPPKAGLKIKNPLGLLTSPRGHIIARVSARNLYAPDFFNFQTTIKIYQLKKYLSNKI